MSAKLRGGVLLWPAVAILASCGNSGSSAAKNVDFLDDSVVQWNNLGFLGAEGHGATRTVSLDDGRGGTRYPGGIVLRAVFDSSPLEAAGLQIGDVLYSVAGDDLPNKEDPTLDALARIESAYTAGSTEIELGYLRGGDSEVATLTLDAERLAPLAPGDFKPSLRYRQAAIDALTALTRMQHPDGSFALATENNIDARRITTAVAGLAYLAGEKLLDLDDAEKQSLPSMAGYDSTRADWCVQFVEGSQGDDSGPVATAFCVMLLGEHIRARGDSMRIMQLAQALAVMLKAQQESGGWLLGGTALGHSESTLATQYCLMALGVAERAGVQMDNQVVLGALAFVKQSTNDGKVGFVPGPGFDRRSEAGRLAGILAALGTLGCSASDPFCKKLADYYREQSADMPRAPTDEAIHLLSAALFSRQNGLPEWIRFTQEHEMLLLSLQRPDGTFVRLPKSRRLAMPLLDDCDSEAWRTAIYALILLLQEDPLPSLLARSASGPSPQRDSDGKQLSSEGPATMTGEPPPGAKMMKFNSVEEAMEFMKSMGIDEDSVQMKQLKNAQKKKDGD